MNKKELKKYFISVTIAFVFFVAYGYLGAKNNLEEARLMVDEIRNEFSFVKDLSPIAIFFIILINNSVKAFLVVISGFLFGLIPLIFLAINGLILGFISYIVSQSEGIGLVLAGILPHGTLEIPAVILAISYGFWLGYKFYRMLRYKEIFKKHLIYSIKFFFKIIFPLLFLAAIVETFITPIIINLLNK